jgi:hypothetical protein
MHALALLLLSALQLTHLLAFDLCIVGDSTLQMFANAWAACETDAALPCAFEVLDAGTYFLQQTPERLYERKSRVVRARHVNCTALFVDFHSPEWLLLTKRFWNARGRQISCRRTLTNFHHHAYAYFKQPRNAASVAKMMLDAERTIKEHLGAIDPLAWLLPTMPLDDNPSFPQTIAEVTETSVFMTASRAETIATLQLLSVRLQRMGDTFADRLHAKRDRLLGDSFTVLAMQSLLAAQFQRAAVGNQSV